MTDNTPDKVIIEGVDNYGRPRQRHADRLATLSDDEFVDVAEKDIWLSAYANNNPRSDYHWMAALCYDEANRRRKPELYTKAYLQASGQVEDENNDEDIDG